MVLDCVKSFRDQVPPELEVIVVDAGDEQVDGTALQALWKNSRVIRSDVRNAAAQRNAGVRAAHGDVIVFLDDDCYVQPNWWPAIVDPLNDPDVGAVAGGVWCNPEPKLTGKRGGYLNLFGVPVQVTHRGPNAPREVDWALTTNMAVRKDVFGDVGGLAEVYGIYDEDVDLGLKIRRSGRRIAFQSSAAVYHYFLKTPRKPVTKRTRFLAGRNRALLIVRNRRLSPTLLVFLLTAPFVQLWLATVTAARAGLKAYGHAAAYCAGLLKGIRDGLKHPVDADFWSDSE